MVPKTVPAGYLSIHETFEGLFNGKFPVWSALASAGKPLGFWRPRDPTGGLNLLTEDQYFHDEREITDFIAEQFCNGDLEIFLHSADRMTERIEPRELNIPFFVSRISDRDFGVRANDGRTVCVRKSDVNRLAAQFTGRRRGAPDRYDWDQIKTVWDSIGPCQGRAEVTLTRLSTLGSRREHAEAKGTAVGQA